MLDESLGFPLDQIAADRPIASCHGDRPVTKHKKRVRELSGIERFHAHLCRHTFATDGMAGSGWLARARPPIVKHSRTALGYRTRASRPVTARPPDRNRQT